MDAAWSCHWSSVGTRWKFGDRSNKLYNAATDRRRAYLYGLGAVLLWSTVASAFKLSLRYLDYAQLLLYACGVSTLVLGSIVLVQKKVGLVFAGGRRAWLRSLALGFIKSIRLLLGAL
jgi:hypothetical protein